MPPPSDAVASVAAPAIPTLLPRADQTVRGIVLLVLATLMFSVSDVTAKYVAATLPAIEVAWMRYLVFVLVTIVPALLRGGDALRTRQPMQQSLRGVTVVASALLFMMGLQRMPIADAAAITFVAPLFITILSVPVLGERVGGRRWAAVAVGMAGAVVAAQPGTSAFQPAAAFPTLSAACWAVAIVLTRKLSVGDRPGTTIAWTAGVGLSLLTLVLPFVARWPTWPEFAGCLVIGAAASGGQSIIVLAYRHAPASLLAPFSYLQLIWSTLFGVAAFGALPSTPTVIGACVIAASGLYAANQERRGGG